MLYNNLSDNYSCTLLYVPVLCVQYYIHLYCCIYIVHVLHQNKNNCCTFHIQAVKSSELVLADITSGLLCNFSSAEGTSPTERIQTQIMRLHDEYAACDCSRMTWRHRNSGTVCFGHVSGIILQPILSDLHLINTHRHSMFALKCDGL